MTCINHIYCYKLLNRMKEYDILLGTDTIAKYTIVSRVKTDASTTTI